MFDNDNFVDDEGLDIVFRLINDLYQAFDSSKYRLTDVAQNNRRLIDLLTIVKTFAQKHTSFDILAPLYLYHQDVADSVDGKLGKKMKRIDWTIQALGEAIYNLHFSNVNVRMAHIILIDLITFIEMFTAYLKLGSLSITLINRTVESKLPIQFSTN